MYTIIGHLIIIIIVSIIAIIMSVTIDRLTIIIIMPITDGCLIIIKSDVTFYLG